MWRSFPAFLPAGQLSRGGRHAGGRAGARGTKGPAGWRPYALILTHASRRPQYSNTSRNTQPRRRQYACPKPYPNNTQYSAPSLGSALTTVFSWGRSDTSPLTSLLQPQLTLPATAPQPDPRPLERASPTPQGSSKLRRTAQRIRELPKLPKTNHTPDSRGFCLPPPPTDALRLVSPSARPDRTTTASAPPKNPVQPELGRARTDRGAPATT